MVNGSALATACTTTTTGLCDALTGLGYVVGAEDVKFIAKYKAKLASARTTLTDDGYFWSIATKAWNYFKIKK